MKEKRYIGQIHMNRSDALEFRRTGSNTFLAKITSVDCAVPRDAKSTDEIAPPVSSPIADVIADIEKNRVEYYVQDFDLAKQTKNPPRVKVVGKHSHYISSIDDASGIDKLLALPLTTPGI